MPTDAILPFLQWLGSSAGLQFIITRLLPRWPWFVRQASKTKMIVIAVLAILLPQIVWFLGVQVPQSVWDQLQPNFQMLMQSLSIVAAWFGGEIGYQGNEALKRMRAPK